MDNKIYKISKRPLGIWPLSLGVLLPEYAAKMRHSDPFSMKRHMHPLKTNLSDGSMVNSNFPRFQVGFNIFQGEVAIQLLLPIETYATCAFPGGVQTPGTTSWSAHTS